MVLACVPYRESEEGANTTEFGVQDAAFKTFK